MKAPCRDGARGLQQIVADRFAALELAHERLDVAQHEPARRRDDLLVDVLPAHQLLAEAGQRAADDALLVRKDALTDLTERAVARPTHRHALTRPLVEPTSEAPQGPRFAEWFGWQSAPSVLTMHISPRRA